MADLHLGAAAHLRRIGKGRRERVVPLTKQTVAVLKTWLIERASTDTDPIFASRRGSRLSRDAIEHLVKHYTAQVSTHCPTLRTKTDFPQTVRHTAAMRLQVRKCI